MQQALPDVDTKGEEFIEQTDWLDERIDEVETIKALWRPGGQLRNKSIAGCEWKSMTNDPVYMGEMLLDHAIFTSMIELVYEFETEARSQSIMSAGRLRALYYNSASFACAYLGPDESYQRRENRREKGTSDRKYRGAKTVKSVTGYLKYGISFKYFVKKATPAVTDTLADKLEDSFLNDTIIDLAALNAAIASGTTRKGIRGPFVVTKSTSTKVTRMR